MKTNERLPEIKTIRQGGGKRGADITIKRQHKGELSDDSSNQDCRGGYM